MHQLKWGNRKPVPKYSIAAGFSTIPPLFVPGIITQDHVVHNSATQRTNDRVRQGLNVISPISGAIPLVGTPLKASIDTLLVVLNGLNTKGENRKNADNLIRRLYRLEAAFSAVPPATPSAQFQRDELARKLDAVSGRLKGMRKHVKSVFGSADIKEAILDCIREIDQQEQDYIVLALMRIELSTQEGAARQLPGSVQQEMVFVKDPTGREFKLLVEQCRSREQFIGVLLCSFGDSDRDKVLRDFIARDAYDLYTETKTGTTGLDKWSGVGAGTRVIMSAVFEQSRYGEDYKCPRPQCEAWNDYRDAKDGWIECVRCPGRFQITNAERRIGNRRTKSGEIPDGSTTPVMGGYSLDLIQIFHLKQQLHKEIISPDTPSPVYSDEELSDEELSDDEEGRESDAGHYEPRGGGEEKVAEEHD